MNTKVATYLCCLIMAVFAVALTITSPFLTEISATYSLSMAQSGMLFTANFIGFTVFVFAGGILADRWGKKKVISIALLGFSAALAAFPLSLNFTMACLIMFFIGGFGGTIECMISALVADLNPDRTGYYINLSQVYFGIGALLGPVAAGYAVSCGMGWKPFYLILGLITLVLAVPFILTRMECGAKPENITWVAFKALVTNRKFLVICLCMALYTGSEVGTWGWMSTFLKQNLQFSTEKAGLAVGVFWVAMTAGRFLCGQLALRFRAEHIIVALASFSTVIIAISGLVTQELLVWGIIAAMGLSFSSLFPLLISFGESQRSTSKGTVFALLLGSGSLGTTVIPLFMGIIGERSDIRVAMSSPALLLLIIVLLFSYTIRQGKGRPT